MQFLRLLSLPPEKSDESSSPSVSTSDENFISSEAADGIISGRGRAVAKIVSQTSTFDVTFNVSLWKTTPLTMSPKIVETMSTESLLVDKRVLRRILGIGSLTSFEVDLLRVLFALGLST